MKGQSFILKKMGANSLATLKRVKVGAKTNNRWE